MKTRWFSRTRSRRRPVDSVAQSGPSTFVGGDFVSVADPVSADARVLTAFLDEIPGAYKDIDQVREDAKDLVRVEHTLRQILNVKGG
jgi:RNA-splicing ligase RtcB